MSQTYTPELFVFISDDNPEHRRIIKDEVIQVCHKNDLIYSFRESASSHETIKVLKEQTEENKYFNILFLDIDFSNDLSEKNSNGGYEILEGAKRLCPPLFILPSSTNLLNSEDSIKLFNEYNRRGLIDSELYKENANPGKTIQNATIEQSIIEAKNRLYLFDILGNHKLILNSSEFKKLSDPDKEAIILNLETVIELLRTSIKGNEPAVIIKLIIHLYNQVIETLCLDKSQIKQDKDLLALKNRYNKNRETINKFYSEWIISFSRDKETNKDKKSNLNLKPWRGENYPPTQWIIAAYSSEEKIKFALDVNWQRNRAIHELNYPFTLGNVFFANLSLTLLVADKREIRYKNSNVFGRPEKADDYGAQKLRDLIDFIKS